MKIATISRDEFLNLPDEELFKHAFPADFSEIVGKRYDIKLKTISKWTLGQRSVFMFIALYYHNTQGWESFLNAYSDAFHLGFMEDLKNGLKYLEDEKLLSIVNSIEEVWAIDNNMDLQREQFITLDDEYEKTKYTSLANAAGYIRDNPDEFIIFKE